MGTKYPMDVAVARSKQTLSIASYLNCADSKNGESPKSLFGKYSRNVLTIINEEKQAVSGNINPIDFISFIKRKSEVCFDEQVRRELRGETNQANGQSASTVSFMFGEFKGKTPAQVLAEHPDGSADQKLQEQYNWLGSNLGKYPKNRTLMDAIEQAFQMRQNGTLAGTAGGPKASYRIYSSGVRPNMYKGERRGNVPMFPVSEIEITWTFGNNYPVEVTVSKYFAPVEKKPDGRLNVHKSNMDKSSLQRNSMRISGDEWISMLELLKLDVDRFNTVSSVKITRDAEGAEQENRTAATAGANGNAGYGYPPEWAQ